MPAVNVEYSEQRLLSEITSLKNEIKTVKALLEKSEVELKLVHDNQNNRFCNICGYAGENFGTSGNDVPIFKRLHIVGGEYENTVYVLRAARSIARDGFSMSLKTKPRFFMQVERFSTLPLRKLSRIKLYRLETSNTTLATYKKVRLCI